MAQTPGTLDATFSSDGVISFSDLRAFCRGNCAAVQPDGRLVFVGTPATDLNTGSVVRLLPDGTLDASFSGDGVTTSTDGRLCRFRAMVLQPDGTYVVGGIGVGRFLPSGLPDTSFSGDGLFTLSEMRSAGGDSDVSNNAEALLIQPDGKLILCHGIYDSVNITRLNADGTLDPSFGSDGSVTTGLERESVDCFGGFVQPDGKIVIAGRAQGPSTAPPEVYSYSFMIRYHPDGSLDSGFARGGRITAYSDAGGFFDVTLLPDGKILAAGNAYSVERYLPNGGLDASFGASGRADLLADGGMFPHRLAVQPNGKILVLGDDNSTDDRLQVFRYNENGTLDTTFGEGGHSVAIDFGSANDPEDLLLQPDGKIVVLSSSHPCISYVSG